MKHRTLELLPDQPIGPTEQTQPWTDIEQQACKQQDHHNKTHVSPTLHILSSNSLDQRLSVTAPQENSTNINTDTGWVLTEPRNNQDRNTDQTITFPELLETTELRLIFNESVQSKSTVRELQHQRVFYKVRGKHKHVTEVM